MHGSTTSPAEIGTYGTTTVIDASQPPYNGTVTFDGMYHVRGDVRLINGGFTLAYNTTFYIDGNNGQAANAPHYSATAIEMQNATLTLRAATLQANCPEPWGGVVLNGQARLYTSAGGAKGRRRSVIRDANTGVYAYTPSWNTPNTNEYYLLQTDFINNYIGLYDLVKGTAQPGEGARYCSFSGGAIGIQFEAIDYTPGNTYGGNYSAALFDYNTFDNLDYGMSGVAGQMHSANNVFTNNYRYALAVYSPPSGQSELRNNTVVVPAAWPADRLATLPAGGVPTSYGIFASGEALDIVANTIEGATPTPAANGVLQIGMDLGSNGVVYGGNTFRYLDQALNLVTNDYTGSNHRVVGNTFEQNVNGVTFSRYSTNPFYTAPVKVTLRCNTFSSTLAGATGVWVKAGALFPSSLGGTGVANNPLPNGNRFSGIADDKKRFVYDAAGPFRYYRYNSPQEEFSTAPSNPLYPGDAIYNYAGNVVTLFADNTGQSGASACGLSSSTAGVYARVARQPSENPIIPPAATGTLNLPYPNPAGEAVSFGYTLPANSEAGRVVVRNLLGNIVAATETRSGTGEANLSVRNLPAGFYTATLEVQGRGVMTQKLTVQR